MKSIYKFWLFIFLTTAFVACKEITPTPVTIFTPGTADFTKYVAIGNSLTAGFASNGLYNSGIAVSYPNLLATQFRRVGGGNFVQPLFTSARSDGSGYLRLIGLPTAAGANIQTYTAAQGAKLAAIGTGALGIPIFEEFTGANQNLGIPGIRLSNVTTDGYGFKDSPIGFNNFFERLLTDGSQLTTSYVDYVTTQAAGATFVSIWLGNNDALGYAAGGGTVAFTDNTLFGNNFDAVAAALPTNAKGIIAGIPQVTTAAFFNTITLGLIQLQLQAGGAPANTPVYIQTAAGTRAATANDRFLLGSQTHYANIGSGAFGAGAPFPYGVHPNNPIVTLHVLDTDEVTAVTTKINEYNTILSGKATAKGWAYFDPNPFLVTAGSATGYVSNGLKFTPTFISGGISSLDGIHLTPAGNAITANEMIKVINAKYGSNIPLLNVANYKTLEVTYL